MHFMDKDLFHQTNQPFLSLSQSLSTPSVIIQRGLKKETAKKDMKRGA